MSDTDPNHRRPGKNGHDQHQDREIREVKATLEKWESAYVQFAKEDREVHEQILSKLTAYEISAKVQAARDDERSKAEKSLRRQVATLFLALLLQAAGVVGWMVAEFRAVHRDIAANTAHFREFQAIGIEWGDAIDERAEKMVQEIRELRREVHQHQRNGAKHVR